MKLWVLASISLALFHSVAINAFGATYYVATTGRDDNQGTEAQPWQTLSHAADHISDGDTVIVRGGTYHEAITISTANVTLQNYPGETPIIDGRNSIPSGTYSSLVVLSANGITLNGFEIRNGLAGRGITIQSVDRCQIKKCLIQHVQEEGIVVWRSADYTLVEDTEIHHHNMNHPNGTNRPWGIGLNVVESSNVTARRCKVHEGYGEGICAGRGSSHVLIEYCVAYDNRALQIYANWSKDVIIRYNLVYGTNNSDFFRYPGAVGNGIVLTNEPWFDFGTAYGRNGKVYGNLVVGTHGGICLHNSGKPFAGAQIYHNTVVETRSADSSHINLLIGSGYTDHIVENNIFLQTNGTIADVPGTGTYTNNLWSKTPEADARGTGDIAGDPQLARTSPWNSMEAGSVQGSEFALQPTSPAIDAGIPLGAEFKNIPDCNQSTWPENIVLIDQDNQGSGWEIGADIHVENQPPSAPSNLRRLGIH